MKQIKSAKAYNHIYERFCYKTDEVYGLDYWDGFTEMSQYELLQMLDELRGVAIVATKIAETEAYEQIEALKQKAVDRANITMGAMILDGYEPEESCVKYVQELIEELKGLSEK